MAGFGLLLVIKKHRPFLAYGNHIKIHSNNVAKMYDF